MFFKVRRRYSVLEECLKFSSVLFTLKNLSVIEYSIAEICDKYSSEIIVAFLLVFHLKNFELEHFLGVSKNKCIQLLLL